MTQTGIHMSSNGLLGCSPDGLINDASGIIEVKCPYSCKESAINASIGKKGFCLKKSGTDETILDPEHDYYHQVQGGMYITGAQFCDFIVWSPQEMIVVRVPWDKTWEVCGDILQQFVREVFLPRVIEHSAK